MDTDHIALQRAAVDALVAARAGESVLLHWFDMDEHRDVSRFGGGIKNKYPIEVECFAVGILTGEPVREEPWGDRHTKWILPVRGQFRKTLISADGFDWEDAGTDPQNMGGTYPSLTESEDTGYDPDKEVGERFRDARAAQVIVGAENIRSWLAGHERFGPYAQRWFPEIMAALKTPASISA